MVRTAMIALALAGAAASPALAQSTQPPLPHYAAHYVFGDSLSDQGNLADALGHNFPSPPFYHDSFTNGPVAVAILSQRLGFSSSPSLYPTGFTDVRQLGLTPGDNYAVAGSTAGNLAGVPGGNLPTQIGAYLLHSGGIASADALYTVFIGGNDVRTAAHQNDLGYVTTGVATELAGIQSLYSAGARNFLVVNVPDIGVIPEFRLGFPDQVALATRDTVLFNNGLAAGLANFGVTSPLARVTQFDLYDFQNRFLANPGAYGITNTTTPCYTSYTGVTDAYTGYTTSAACGSVDPTTGQPANIGSLAFWDSIHPTATVQRAIGDALATRIAAVAPVPEPATWMMMLAGFATIGAMMRRGMGPGRRRPA